MKALLFLCLISSFSWSQTCDPEKIVQDACAYFEKNKHLKMIKTSSGHQYINPAAFDEMLKAGPENIFADLPKPSEEQITRVNKIFQSAQESLIEKIKNGIENEKHLSNEKQNLIARIRILKLLRPEDMTREQIMECATSKDGAFFLHVNSTISICPLRYLHPEAIIQFSIGHEIGHIFDPCMSQFPVYEIQQSSISSLPEDHPGKDGWARFFVDGDDASFHLVAQGNANEKIQTISDVIDLKKPKIEGISPEKHPYRTINQCFKKGKSFRFVQSDPKDCQQSTHNEVFCDTMGAWHVSDSSSSDWSPSERRDFVGGLFPDICRTAQFQKISENGHPPSRVRMQNAILSVPGMLEKFGCKKPKMNSCTQILDSTQRSKDLLKTPSMDKGQR